MGRSVATMAGSNPWWLARRTIHFVKQFKNLEQENARLKKLLAERDLEIKVMKEINAKKW